MSVKIIELNDRAVHVGDETGVILQSPGFALADGSSIDTAQNVLPGFVKRRGSGVSSSSFKEAKPKV